MRISKGINQLFKTGFFHIFSTSILNKIIGFCSGIILVRILSKSDYGLYSYVINLINLFMLVEGIGAISGILQFGSEYKDDQYKKNAFAIFGLKIGVFANIIITCAIAIFSVTANFKIEGSKFILLAMSAIPLMNFIISFLSVNVRINFLNKKYSLISFTNSVLLLTCNIIGAYFWNVMGIAIMTYVSAFLTIVIALFISYKIVKQLKYRTLLTKYEKRSFLKISVVSSFNNAISQLLYILDTFLIGLIIVDNLVIASYKTATMIPFALAFIPSAIMTYMYPYFASHINDKVWVKKKLMIVVGCLALINALIVITLTAAAPFIIKLIFGAQYLDAVTPFRILTISYLFSGTLHVVCGNIIVSQKKLLFNFILACSVGVLNIVLDILFIKIWGSTGAAIATLFIVVISSVTSFIYLLHYLLKKSKEEQVV